MTVAGGLQSRRPCGSAGGRVVGGTSPTPRGKSVPVATGQLGQGLLEQEGGGVWSTGLGGRTRRARLAHLRRGLRS